MKDKIFAHYEWVERLTLLVVVLVMIFVAIAVGYNKGFKEGIASCYKCHKTLPSHHGEAMAVE